MSIESRTKALKQYWDYLIDPRFQEVKRLFVLPFENNAVKTGHTGFFCPTKKIQDYNVITDGKNVFDQEVKHDIKK